MFTKKSILFLLVCFVLTSCTKEDIQPSIDNLNNETSSETFTRSGSNSVVIRARQDGPPDGEFIEVPGASSKLHRAENGITVNFETENLIPNNAYTLWWIVFGDDPGPPTSTYAAGQVVGANGKSNFYAHKCAGEDFNNPLTADVHLVLHSHGQAVPGMIPDQISTLDGGCVIILPSGPGQIWPDSDEVGFCADVQVAMHPGK